MIIRRGETDTESMRDSCGSSAGDSAPGCDDRSEQPHAPGPRRSYVLRSLTLVGSREQCGGGQRLSSESTRGG